MSSALDRAFKGTFALLAPLNLWAVAYRTNQNVCL